MADAELRQRKPQGGGNGDGDGDGDGPDERTKAASAVRHDDDYSPWLDVLRVLSFLVVASCALSYVISGGQSWFWGMQNKPYYLRAEWWRTQLSGPIYLTPDELLAYDGRDADKPLYLAINGTIYDVSNGRRMYGPGGSYNALAGCDAGRGFVTGCFAEDRTADMRGVEEMFLPLDDAATDAHWTTAEFAALRARELTAAREQAHKALAHWVNFFAKSKKYHRVGYVRRDADWLDKTPPRALCAAAQARRKKRALPTDGN